MIQSNELKHLHRVSIFNDRIEYKYERADKLSQQTIRWTVVKEIPNNWLSLKSTESLYIYCWYNEGFTKLLPSLQSISHHKNNYSMSERHDLACLRIAVTTLRFKNKLSISFDKVFYKNESYSCPDVELITHDTPYPKYAEVKAANQYTPTVTCKDAASTES